ncbi:hypothetical protein LZ32DRAFT_554423 [Colletotrichum eremochloae]|nr:hypothetical protein LZ32DRAFT_554423 [Colletotrichum eremochloae]
MRLPLVSRSHTSVLTRGRWPSAPDWQGVSRRHQYRSSQAAAVAQRPSTWQTTEVTSPNSASYPQFEAPKLPDAKSELHTNVRYVLSRNSFLGDDESPNRFLADVLDLYRRPAASDSSPKRDRLRSLAATKSTKLVTITAKHILRHVKQLDPRIGKLLCSHEEWLAQLHPLVSRGITAEDISYWAWILVPHDPDIRVARFMSRPCHKPTFILRHLLLKDTHMSSESFQALMEYCRRWYSGPQTGHDVGKAFDLYLIIDPLLFNGLAEELCFHASRIQPDALPEIADLSVAYIKGITRRDPDKAYRLQCQVFNSVLQAVSFPSTKSPYEQASQNWRAVTILLSMSSSLERPLIIEEESYRAIRHVLLALPKTASERDTASALSSSWPPYRILRDGMEEKAGTQQYLSRVVKAGLMMAECGYSRKETDVITDVLGGMAPDGSPTIQTRTNYPRRLHAEQGMWAALIRTTRNAQEAWALFSNPPESGIRPTFEVYRELMLKLAAAPADPEHDNLPGDGREVFPFDDRNLSDFEKARISPPSLPQLIEHMSNAGVAIRERTLAWLLRQASDVETALKYINHSSVSEALKNTLGQCLKEYQGPVTAPPTRIPGSINLPHELLHAIVDIICRLQPNRTANTPYYLTQSKFYPIHYAIRLAQTGQKSAHPSDQAPWESIMLALGRPNIMVSSGAPQDNDLTVVKMALEVLEKAEERGALSLDMLDSFSQAVRKAVYSNLSILLTNTSTSAMLGDKELMSLYRVQSTELTIPHGSHVFRRPETADNMNGSWRQILTPVFKARQEQNSFQTPYIIIREASERLKAAWRVLSTKASAHQPLVDSRVTALHINGYMRTLAAVGDLEEMVLLLCWAVRDWVPAAGTNMSTANVRRLFKAVIVFRAFAEPLLHENVVASLREEIELNSERGGPVHWPTDQEVEEYIQGDQWGRHQSLHEVVKLAAVSEQEHRLSGARRHKDVNQEVVSCKIRS